MQSSSSHGSRRGGFGAVRGRTGEVIQMSSMALNSNPERMGCDLFAQR